MALQEAKTIVVYLEKGLYFPAELYEVDNFILIKDFTQKW